MRLIAVLVPGVLLVLSCSRAEDSAPPERLRPVTVIRIEDAAPHTPGRITGLAEPFRSEAVGFEVAGRLAFVQDVGMEFEGPTLDADGAVLEPGEPLAWLDPARYEQALDATTLARESAARDLEAMQVEVNTVAQSQLDEAKAQEGVAEEKIRSAQANEDLARITLERQTELLAQGVVSQSDFDNAKRDYDNTVAQVQAARGSLVAAQAAVATAADSIQFKLAQIESAKAVVAEYANRVVLAETDLADCVLRAPFSGRITERATSRGGYVQPGEPVVTLTMLDPIKVVVMATAENSRKLLPGSQAAVVPKDLASFTDEPALYGVIFDKAEVADAATRTFKIEVVLRNVRRSPYLETGEGTKVAFVERMLPALTREAGGDGPLFIHPHCILTRDGSDYVYRLPGVKLGLPSNAELTGVLQPEEIAIERLPEYFTLRYSFQRIADGSGLVAGDVLISEPRPEQLAGAVLPGYDWAIRPGDSVPASFDLGDSPRGFYVPTEAIAILNGETSVFAVGEDGRAQELSVTVHETVGMRRRIEGEGLEDGLRLVLDGVHYVADGEKVRIVARLGS